MATYSKLKLGGSTDGRGIEVTGTGTGSSVAVHTAHATSLDEIHVWAFNTDTSDRTLTIEFGGTTTPDDLIEFVVPATDGLYLVIPGLILTNSSPVTAFASAGNVIVLFGYVNRIA
jgi:hypothetical protein